MEHKLINTGDYLLIVDDSEIKEGDWVYCWETINGTPSNFDIVLMTSKNYTHWVNGADNYKKVISHLPLNNSPILEGVDLLPPLEDEVEKLAKEEIERYRLSSSSIDKPREVQRFNGFKTGYNKAKEKYRYTEEDIKAAYIEGGNRGAFYRALEEAEDWDALKELDENYHKNLGEFIQSLQQPKIPVGFSTLEQWYNPKTNKAGYSLPEVTGLNDNDGCYMVHSVITNSQGLTQWIGEYIY